MSKDPADIWLFSYGTLRQKNVQLATFGRELEGREDALVGFVSNMIAISDPEVVATSGKTHHPIVASHRQSGRRGCRHGFPDHGPRSLPLRIPRGLTDERVAVRLKSGREAFVYVRAAGA